VVVGIAASGRTPYVWGGLAAAREAGARTALLCFNPHLKFSRSFRPDVVLAIDVGPEVLTGSTRLKAGTATKLVLNILSTLTMVRLGKVEENLMIDLNPSNLKLRDRACRIVQELTLATPEMAQSALEASGWRVQAAVQALRQKRSRT
jgi:N-acetylmuramic acid 6-phosphate etherase